VCKCFDDTSFVAMLLTLNNPEDLGLKYVDSGGQFSS